MIIRFIRIKRLLLLIALLVVVLFFIGHSKPFLRLVYPVPYQEETVKYARRFELDPLLISAVMRAESRFDPYAQSSKGALGLMQLMPDTAKWVAGQMQMAYSEERLTEPEFNIAIGCWYLSSLANQYDGNLALALAAYNGGKTNVNSWLENRVWSGRSEDIEDIPFPETREYVKTVLRNYKRYQKIYDS